MSESNDGWINNVGSVLEAKGSGNKYIKIEQDITLKAGDRLAIRSKPGEIESAVEAGRLTREKADELLEKLHFVKHTLHRMPRG